MESKLNVISREERITDYILPCKVLACEGAVENAEALLRKKTLQIGLYENDCVRVSDVGFITLDFGKEIQGGVRILTHGAGGGCKVRLRFGESVSEVYSDARPSTDTYVSVENAAQSATNDHSFRDFIADLTYMSDMCFGNTGFRFLRIDFLTGFEITIKNIVGVFVHRDLRRRGFFECSDSVVNNIFETAAYTVELCMQNMLWDGIKRDRLVWIGDMHPETLSILSLYGADPCIEQSLSFICDNTPLPNFMNNMAAYSLWWLCIMSDYYLYTGRIKLLQRHKEYIVGLVELLDSYLDERGRLHFADDGTGFFLDWPSCEYPEKRAGVYALFAIAMQKSKLLLRALRLDCGICERAMQRIDRRLDGGNFKQINAFKVLAGHLAPERAASGLIRGGGKGLSTFMSYYILSAIAECGKREQSLAIMREYYNGMLQRGATTFWEDFDLSWLEGSGRIDRLPLPHEKDIHADFGAHCYTGLRHSLCHGWASGPVPFLMRSVLGVTPLEPGFRRVEIKPSLCGLAWARGAFPTPFGNIEISLENVNGKMQSRVNVPAEIKMNVEDEIYERNESESAL